MLTRLKINGFKNLNHVDLRFGFFTCIAGPNGVGKSNLFDAIQFLSNLSSMQIAAAAALVRGMDGRSASLASLFSYADESGHKIMDFLVEVIVPAKVIDDYSQEAKVTSTCLEYVLSLRLVESDIRSGHDERIEIIEERLRPRTVSAVRSEWNFPGKELALKHVHGKRTNPFIETKDDAGIRKIFLRSDGSDAGAPLRAPLTTPRTVLSGVDSKTHASHLALRREMQSWQLLQLEPSALREPDAFGSDSRITARGEHLPAAIHRMNLAADVAADLSRLVRGIEKIEVVSNDVLRLRTLVVSMHGQPFQASALSDGTLRFLALSAMACDPERSGLVCMEEPENGIHPIKIPEMVDLVKDLSDANSLIDTKDISESPLKQVVINTHSPLVVGEVFPDDLLFAQTVHFGKLRYVEYLPMSKTWRHLEKSSRAISPGEVRSFLSGVSVHSEKVPVVKRVRDIFAGTNQKLLDI